jgi:DNA-directed RNA polymerase subunit RPC12/RpoP
MQLQSTLTCPKCSHQVVETMPTDACQFFYDCNGCGERLKPLAGDRCVFCSYGSVPCPPVQSNLRCCVSEMRHADIPAKNIS